MICLPFFTRKDKFPEFKVSEYNGGLVAMSHSRDNLFEKAGSLLFWKTLAPPHVRMHISKVLIKKDVGLGFPKNYFHNPRDISV